MTSRRCPTCGVETDGGAEAERRKLLDRLDRLHDAYNQQLEGELAVELGWRAAGRP